MKLKSQFVKLVETVPTTDEQLQVPSSAVKQRFGVELSRRKRKGWIAFCVIFLLTWKHHWMWRHNSWGQPFFPFSCIYTKHIIKCNVCRVAKVSELGAVERRKVGVNKLQFIPNEDLRPCCGVKVIIEAMFAGKKIHRVTTIAGWCGLLNGVHSMCSECGRRDEGSACGKLKIEVDGNGSNCIDKRKKRIDDSTVL